MSSFVHEVRVHDSILIKEDLLCSREMIVEINDSLKTHIMGGKRVDRASIGFELDRVIYVYNQNVNYINCQCKTFKFSDQSFQTFGMYQASHPTEPALTALEEYEKLKTTEKAKYSFILEEVRQLAQAGYLHQDLKGKIETAIQRVLEIGLFPKEVIPPLATPAQQDLHRICSMDRVFPIGRPQLRYPSYESKLKDFLDNNNSTSSASATTTSSVPSTPDQAVPAEVSKSVVETPQPFAVVCIGSDFIPNSGVLGICHEPSWGEQPVPFTQIGSSNSNLWTCHIPLDKEYKFVIVDNGTVTQWEQGPNRRLAAEDPSLDLSVNPIKFS